MITFKQFMENKFSIYKENNEYDERNIENENSKIQIEMKGRNSKTPKRVKISILYFNLIFPRLIMVQDLAHR